MAARSNNLAPGITFISQCSKPCGTGSRTRTVLCLANNETANIAECGMDGIPFAEEKCNTDACSEDTTAEPVTDEPTMIEVCEEVEVEEEPECEDESEPDDKGEMMEEGSGSGEASLPLVAGSGESEGLMGTSEESMPEMSGDLMAEGSGDLEPESVALSYQRELLSKRVNERSVCSPVSAKPWAA